MLAANQGQNNSRGLPRCSLTLIELMPFCSTSSARGAGVGRSTGVSLAAGHGHAFHKLPVALKSSRIRALKTSPQPRVCRRC